MRIRGLADSPLLIDVPPAHGDRQSVAYCLHKKKEAENAQTLCNRTQHPGRRQDDRAGPERRRTGVERRALAASPRVQWEHSYVAGDKTFCIYLAEDEEAIREHARLSGFPANTITPVSRIIDPTTAAG